MQGATSYQSLENSEDMYSPKKSKCMGLLNDSLPLDKNNSRSNRNSGLDQRSDSSFSIFPDSICDESNTSCCSYSCQVCCSDICFKLKSSTNVQHMILWIWLTSSSLILGFILWKTVFNIFYQDSFSIGDQILIDTKLAPIFCESVSITSNGTFNGGLINYEPPINYTHIRKQHIYGNTTFEKSFFLRYYLLEKSIVRAEILSKNQVELYIIEGKENYTEWEMHNSCTDCYLYYLIDSTEGQKINFIVNKSAFFYFIMNDPFEKTQSNNEAYFDLRLWRTSYVATDIYTTNCMNVLNCTLPYDFFSNEKLLFESVFKCDGNSDSANIFVYCDERKFGYIFMLCIIPLCFGVFISLIISNILPCKRTKSPAYSMLDGSIIENERTQISSSSKMIPKNNSFSPEYHSQVHNSDNFYTL